MSAIVVSNLTLWIIVAIHTVMLVAVLRHLGTNLLRGQTRLTQGPPIGTRPPELNVQNLLGQSIALGTPNSSVRNVFFLSTSCTSCPHVLRALDGLRGTTNDAADIFIVRGSDDAVTKMASEHDLDLQLVVADGDGAFGDAWRVVSRPFAVALDQTGLVVDSGVPESGEQLRAMLRIAPEGIDGVGNTAIAVSERR